MVVQGHTVRGWQVFEAVRMENDPLHFVLNLLRLCMIQYGGDHRLCETVELLISRHEVSLAVNLSQRGVISINCHSDQPLASAATLQLGRLGPAILLRLFSQPLFSLEQGRTKRFRRKSIRVARCMLRRS